MKKLMMKTLAVAGMTMGLALGAKAEDRPMTTLFCSDGGRLEQEDHRITWTNHVYTGGKIIDGKQGLPCSVYQGEKVITAYELNWGYLFSSGSDKYTNETVAVGAEMDLSLKEKIYEAEAYIYGTQYLTVKDALAVSATATPTLMRNVSVGEDLTVGAAQTLTAGGYVITNEAGVVFTVQGTITFQNSIVSELVNNGTFVVESGGKVKVGSKEVVGGNDATFITTFEGSVLTFSNKNCTVTGWIWAKGVGDHGHKFILGDADANTKIMADQNQVPAASIDLAENLKQDYVVAFEQGCYFAKEKVSLTVVDEEGVSEVKVVADGEEVSGPPYKVPSGCDVAITYTADEGHMFPGGYKTLTTNVTASAATTTVTLTAEQKPVDAVANLNCLTFSAAEAFGIRMNKGKGGKSGSKTYPAALDVNLEYSTDQIYWQTFNADTDYAAGADHKFYLRGKNNAVFASDSVKSSSNNFTNTSDSVATAIACSGNIETLLDYQTVAKGEHPTMADYAFQHLFNGFTTLTEAPDLPATNLMQRCYGSMFSGCTSLTEAPKLPAKEVANACYQDMFTGCTSLTEVPDLPATNLQKMCYYNMFKDCTSLVVNTNAPGKAWSLPAEAKTSATSADMWNKYMFMGTPGNITNATVTCGVTYYVASAIPPVTVEVPEVEGATAQLLAFKVNGGWKATATNEVPSNATVRVVYTAEDGKALSGEGATGVFVWQTEFVASNSVQTAPQPIVGEAGESEITLSIDTRTKKSYFDAADILPVWYAAGAEVKVEKEGGQRTTLVKSSATTNTLAWFPAEQGTYNFSQNGFNDAQIIYTTPVEVTTNGLEVTGTTVAVTADGAPIEPQTEEPYAGKLMVASNSTVTATWTIAPGSGVYFMDGTTTYTQTFEAGKAVNPVSEAVTKPEKPKAPKLKLGVVAQRYPWDGKIDVQYWAQNTPNEGYQISITVTLPDGTTASETKPCLNGKNVTDFNAREHFGEVQIPKGVKVKATLIPSVELRPIP